MGWECGGCFQHVSLELCRLPIVAAGSRARSPVCPGVSLIPTSKSALLPKALGAGRASASTARRWSPAGLQPRGRTAAACLEEGSTGVARSCSQPPWAAHCVRFLMNQQVN